MDHRPQWYCARTKPGQERLAIDNLERQSFTVYFPQLAVERIRNGKIKNESEALFPSYLLIEMVLTHAAWRTINATRGVIRLLGNGVDGAPSPARRDEIDALRKRDLSGQLRVSEIKHIRPGDHVRVLTGHMANQIGVCAWTKRERVAYLLGLLGRQVMIVAPAHTLAVVSASERIPVR